MKKLWKKWCLLCDAHNVDISYANYEDYYSPDDIFFPLLVSVIAGVLFGLGTMSLKICALSFIFMLIGMYAMFIIGFVLSFPKKKEVHPIRKKRA